MPVAAAGGGATTDPLAGMREHLEGECAIVKQLGGGALFPVRGCSSSLCLHWMCMGIERNGAALQRRIFACEPVALSGEFSFSPFSALFL
jgi:hypothetical protein